MVVESLDIALAQINLLVGDIEGNAQKVIETAQRARHDLNARLVLYPELTLTGYPPEDLLFRPELMQRVGLALAEIRRSLSDQGVAVVIGYPRQTGSNLFNSAGLIDGGELLLEYDKARLPNYSVFDEKRYFQPGDQPGVVTLDGIKLGLTICEDIWSPEPAQWAKAAGAELLLNLNASPFHRSKTGEREALVQQRARETGLPILYVNLVGGQDELVFDGASFAVNGDGSLMARLPSFEEALIPIELRWQAGQWVIQSAPQAEPLDDLASVYQALVLGVRDYVTKNGFQGAVLGLSGGIDSALTLAIAVDALGSDHVEVVSMPSRYTADMSNEDAEQQARTMGVYQRAIPIEPAFQAFQNMLADEFAGFTSDTTEENIQARCRGILLMAISNKKGRILLTTGNKSEMSVGYATLYGDMAGGFAPIKDVPKTLVYALAEWRNRDQEVIPRRVIERPPSAELRPDQQDSDSLPDYDVLDAILYRYIEQDECEARIVEAGFDAEVVARVARLVDRNEYKRRQAPLGVRITQRAFGRDRRYPMTSGF